MSRPVLALQAAVSGRPVVSAKAGGRRSLVALACALLVDVLLAGHSPAAPTVKRLAFDIFRNGDPIGSHVTTITVDGAQTTVDTRTSIKVKVLFLDAYHFDFTAREVLVGGKFASFASRTDDNGTRHRVEAKREDGKLEVTADGRTSQAASNAIPGSFWSEDQMRSGPVIMTETGSLAEVEVTKIDEETGASGRKLEHYRIGGGMDRDIWFYDHYPVRYRLVARDGSVIESRASSTTE